MHIPDGYLDPTLVIVFVIVSLAFIIPAFFQAKKYLGTKAIPLFAVLTAGVFAFQLINFPIVGGTSGHLVGGTLISVFLGPFGALISMSIILLIQAFVFADGGITALGANIFNMGVIGGFVGYYLYLGVRKLVGKGNWGIRIGAAVGSYLAIVLAALACGLQLGWSYTFPYGLQYTVPAMVGWHLVIGIGEAIITVTVIEYVIRMRPDLLELPKIGLKRLLSWRTEKMEEASNPGEKKDNPRKNSKKSMEVK
ncbi:MAG: energy-coupling factor ABC transporter permease [Candidatus Jordarchaeum sp.]|uniref:energy-coupling factor ABC transporter permease n=1 Tax=Candidatus Jordarchaeum sp. TaxID=2823881 RepID=UPI004048EF83